MRTSLPITLRVSRVSVSFIFFLGLTLLYLSLSPTEIMTMGYTGENVRASTQIISNLGDWFSFRFAQTAVVWPRHGIFDVIFQIPFLLMSRIFWGASTEWADHLLSLQPIIATSLLCTLIFKWTSSITSSQAWGFALAMIAAFSTMLWPYAYIGMETTQSLFVMLSAYLALGPKMNNSWRRALLFSISCALAIGVKSNGVVLFPAIAYLVYSYFRTRLSANSWRSITNWKQPVAVISLTLSLYLLSAYTRALSPVWANGEAGRFFNSSRVNPISFLLNVCSVLGSVNSGLFVYCPVALLCVAAMFKLYKTNREIVTFATLVLVGLVCGCSLFFFWADETWGPRYLHSAMGPLIVCLSLSRKSVGFHFKKEIPLMALTAFGVAISFLGMSFFYGVLHSALINSTHPTIEAFQYEPEWNHIRFNLKLLRVWLRKGQPLDDSDNWPPPRRRWFPAPGEGQVLYPEHPVKLTDYAHPQPLLFRDWETVKGSSLQPLWYVCLICLCLGPVLLIWLARLTLKADQQSETG